MNGISTASAIGGTVAWFGGLNGASTLTADLVSGREVRAPSLLTLGLTGGGLALAAAGGRQGVVNALKAVGTGMAFGAAIGLVIGLARDKPGKLMGTADHRGTGDYRGTPGYTGPPVYRSVIGGGPQDAGDGMRHLTPSMRIAKPGWDDPGDVIKDPVRPWDDGGWIEDPWIDPWKGSGDGDPPGTLPAGAEPPPSDVQYTPDGVPVDGYWQRPMPTPKPGDDEGFVPPPPPSLPPGVFPPGQPGGWYDGDYPIEGGWGIDDPGPWEIDPGFEIDDPGSEWVDPGFTLPPPRREIDPGFEMPRSRDPRFDDPNIIWG